MQLTSIGKTIQLLDTICTDEGLPYTIIGGIVNYNYGLKPVKRHEGELLRHLAKARC